ncbi:MAG TPA: YifB family Mg chelatase-like AAA ATPase [Oligoflexia bacterium]|nr:YifB family Mg chelatase-like AAA ATPase [Oligoflexia bacterium]HMP26770.1 YifB family Mg chelatase-like AAA ATPase [Oligoflexia bacterium]
MLARAFTSIVVGVRAIPIEVEARLFGGQPNFSIIGLGDNAVKEARDRVQSALSILNYCHRGRVLINLAPAELKKEGSSFDLAITVGILAAAKVIPAGALEGRHLFGEIALNGEIRPVRGVVSSAIVAKELGVGEIIVPFDNIEEASLISGLTVRGARSVAEVAAYLKGVGELPVAAEIDSKVRSGVRDQYSFRGDLFTEVLGQERAKRALTIAAAGGHNVLLIGPPGCGKSMLASRFTGLLPRLNEREKLEVVKIHSVAGSNIRPLLDGEPPFRAPHHIVSDVGLIGGGAFPKPGEISLAHRGVLFLDEFPEFRRNALEALRAPLEQGSVTVTRAKSTVTYPAEFQLIATMNPCPCGRLGSNTLSKEACMCSRSAIKNYLRKLSGPILDRIDLHVELESVPISTLTQESTSNIQNKGAKDLLCSKIFSIRKNQIDHRGALNSRLTNQALKKVVRFERKALNLAEQMAQKLSLSARSYFKVLKIALTISELNDSSEIKSEHLAEALSYRVLDRIAKYAEGNG